jgi:carnitine monooxygenase subunit
VSRDQLVQFAHRTLAHAKAGTAPLADGVMQVESTRYYEPERWRAEMDRIFGRVPLVLGLSVELREPNTYKALEICGVNVLVVRGADRSLRAFVNMCSHRGARLVEHGVGSARRFTCPYHAWTYDTAGALVGVFDRADVGDIDTACLGLTELPVAERAGLIFGGITPLERTGGAPLVDIDTYLGGYTEMLEAHDFANAWHVGSQVVTGPNWKVAYDGYLDFYHLPVLHRQTFGTDYPNKNVTDAWGPHQRLTQPDHRIMKLAETDESQWPTPMLLGGVWTIFPHVSIAAFDAGGRLYQISQLLPGDDPDTSTTVQHFVAMFDPETSPLGRDEAWRLINERRTFLRHVVQDEDYFTGVRIQRNVKTGVKPTFLLGRNEWPLQRFHQWVDRIISTDDAELASLFATAPQEFAP